MGRRGWGGGGCKGKGKNNGETVKANHIQMGKLVRATVERNRAEQKRGKLSQRREEEEGGVGPERGQRSRRREEGRGGL